MKNKKTQTNKKKKRRPTLLYILSGGILKEEFFIKHTSMIVLVVALLFLFISNRYSCLLKLKEIDKLQKELKDVKNESLSLSGQLTGSNRLSQIEKLVETKQLKIESAKTPPFILYK